MDAAYLAADLINADYPTVDAAPTGMNYPGFDVSMGDLDEREDMDTEERPMMTLGMVEEEQAICLVRAHDRGY